MRSYIFLLLIAGVALFFRLGNLPLTGADEPRYARIAEEMRLDGRWITPILQGIPWLEKPPLYYWITIPFYSLLGTGEAAARLGPALCALLAAWAVCWAASRNDHPLAGFLAGTIILTSMGWVVFGRGASTDMPFTACYTGCLALLYAGAAAGRPSLLRLLSAYMLLGLAILAKGPVAIVLAAGTLILFWAFNECGRGTVRLYPAPGMLISLAVALPWFWEVFRENGYTFITVYFVNHNLTRYVSEVHHHVQPVYYYLPVLIGLLFPWTGWFAAFAGRVPETLRGWRRWPPARLLLVCWFLFPLLFFSFSGSKLPSYILVSVPPLAILLGSMLAAALRAEGGDPAGLAAGTRSHLFLSAAVAAALPVVFRRYYEAGWAVSIPLAATVLVPAAVTVWLARRRQWTGAVSATAAQSLVIIVALTQFAFPVLGAYHSTRDIARQALALRGESEPIVTHRFFHHTLFYYTDYQVAAESSNLESLQALAYRYPRLLIVTERKYLAEVAALHGFVATELGRQGKLSLVRLSHR